MHFNTSYVVIKRILQTITAIPEANFNTSYVVIKLELLQRMGDPERDFNTSYVVIKRKPECWFIKLGWISIHLMLLLNTLEASNIEANKAFQYILCCY